MTKAMVNASPIALNALQAVAARRIVGLPA